MKAKQKNLSAVVLLVLLVIGCLLQYNNYIHWQIYYESTQDLLETYEQVDKTILMFAQRNWNVLSDWGSYLHEITGDEDIRKWHDFGEEKRTWNYSDFYLANTDGLTGLFNSRYFSRVLQLKEEKRQRFTLFYLDLDRFKPINDTYGHDVGDKLLREVAVRLQDCIRTSDYAFRIGGDEFALIVNEALEKHAREERVALIRKTILKPFDIDGNHLCVSTSCGCASYPEEAAHTEDIRIIADQRMYEDKEKNHAGR